MKFVTVILLTVILLLLFILFSLNSTSTAIGTTITTPVRSFYIPSHQPLKVYSFDPHPNKLKTEIEQLVAQSPAKFGVFIKNLSTGQEITINPDEQFPTASLYKLAVMFAVFDLSAAGKVNINDPQIQSNLNSMITVSSNTAAYYFIDNIVSWEKVTNIIQKQGLKDTTLSQDPPLTTPRDMAKLLEMISTGKAVNTTASAQMLNLMVAQQINDRIPVLLPAGVDIAHKTGELGNVRHDAGVILGPENDFILVLMSKDSTNPEQVKPIMAKISLSVFEFFQKQWANPPEIL